MHLQIHGKQIDVGTALRARTEAKITSAVAKYFDRDASGTVTYSRPTHEFACDCNVHLSSGLTLQASGAAADANIALDVALERLEKRLRRYKRRLKEHRGKSDGSIETVTAQAYVIEDSSDETDNEPNSLEPVIVAELTSEVKSLTVGEAVMQMNLTETVALLFINRGTGRLNMVYRRSDGNIGWIDPPAQNLHGPA